MSDRERLIDLIREAKKHTKNANSDLERNMIFAEYLLEHGVIVPPCKVGDTVWWVTEIVDENCEEKPDILLGEIASFSVQKEGLWAFCRYANGLTFWHLVSDYFGKTVFLTREDAERALKERENNA